MRIQTAYAFAVVALSGATFAPLARASVVPAGLTILTEMTDNGQVDEGEAFSARFCVRNPESTPTPPLLGTLLDGGGIAASDPLVSSTAAIQATFGSLAPGETVCRTFAFRVSASCGRPAVATLALQTVAPTSDFALLPFALPSGPVATAESFDSVTPPLLPGAWLSVSAMGTSGWSTHAVTPDTAPNAAFVPGANGVDTALVSPPISLRGGGSVLTFRNFYNIEANWDGAVLEIAIGAGAYTDIVVAGGVFLAGGYNTNNVISGPLVGRRAWSGNAGGYLTTQVLLPLSAANQAVRLRWRYGTDASVAAVGWRVDSVTVTSQDCEPVPLTSPSGLRATVHGREVELGWLRPASGVPAGYLLEASADGGTTFPVSVPLGPAPTFKTTGPDGVFVVRVRAALGGGALSPPGAPLTIAIGTALPPATPRQLLWTANGGAVDLAWSLDEPGGVASAVVLEAGSAPGLADRARLVLPAGTSRFAASGVPPGAYYLRVRQQGPAALSAASHEIAVSLPGSCVPPAPPFYLTGEIAGSTIDLWWELGGVGTAAPTAWQLVARDRITSAVLGSVVVGQRRIVAPLPPGQYLVQAFAVNACGTSATPAVVTFDIP